MPQQVSPNPAMSFFPLKPAIFVPPDATHPPGNPHSIAHSNSLPGDARTVNDNVNGSQMNDVRGYGTKYETPVEPYPHTQPVGWDPSHGRRVESLNPTDDRLSRGYASTSNVGLGSTPACTGQVIPGRPVSWPGHPIEHDTTQRILRLRPASPAMAMDSFSRLPSAPNPPQHIHHPIPRAPPPHHEPLDATQPHNQRPHQHHPHPHHPKDPLPTLPLPLPLPLPPHDPTIIPPTSSTISTSAIQPSCESKYNDKVFEVQRLTSLNSNLHLQIQSARHDSSQLMKERSRRIQVEDGLRKELSEVRQELDIARRNAAQLVEEGSVRIGVEEGLRAEVAGLRQEVENFRLGASKLVEDRSRRIRVEEDLRSQISELHRTFESSRLQSNQTLSSHISQIHQLEKSQHEKQSQIHQLHLELEKSQHETSSLLTDRSKRIQIEVDLQAEIKVLKEVNDRKEKQIRSLKESNRKLKNDKERERGEMEGKVRRLENEGSIARALVQKVYWENKRLVGVLKGLIDMKKQQQQQEDTDSPFESTPPTKQGEEGEGELAMIIDPKSIPTPTPTPTPSLLPNDKHPPQAKGYDIDNHYPTPNIKKEDPSSSSSSSFPFATTTTTTSFSSTFSSINTNTYQTKPHPTEIDHGLAFDPLVPLLPPSSIKKDELDPDDLDLLWPEY